MKRSPLATALATALTACAYLPATSPHSPVAHPMAGGPIEAGCAFWGAQLKGEVGSVHDVICPAHCKSASVPVAGTDVYIEGSSICAAAIHAGAMLDTGGRVSVRIEPGRQAYVGSTRHGVYSADYGMSFRSISFVR